MARTIAFLLLTGSLLIGCTRNPPGPIAGSLPAPNFDGKAITHAPAPPVYVPPPPEVRPGPTAGIPREWVPPGQARQWRWIVIHHSATPGGSAAVFDKMHREERGWDELGYHFVVGNGTDSRNGQVEVGSRWQKQKHGAHAKTPDNRFNDFGIGICLVGNFDHERPTREQMQSLARLAAHLMRTYRIPPDRVIGHGDTSATNCPGEHLRLAEVRRLANQILAESGHAFEPVAQQAGRELLVSDRP